MRSADLKALAKEWGIPMLPPDHPIYSEGPQITLSSHTRAQSPGKAIVSLPKSTESEDDGESDNMCSYCNIEDDCEHLLLSVDVTFRQAGGGELYERLIADGSLFARSLAKTTILMNGRNLMPFSRKFQVSQMLRNILKLKVALVSHQPIKIITVVQPRL